MEFKITILSLKNHVRIADECNVAESFFDRLRGLIGKKSLKPGQGLWLTRCNSIHMWFMSIPIDVVFVRREESKEAGKDIWKVTAVRENMMPWRIFPVRDGKSTDTLELPVGTIKRCDVQIGDYLCTS